MIAKELGHLEEGDFNAKQVCNVACNSVLALGGGKSHQMGDGHPWQQVANLPRGAALSEWVSPN